MEQNYFEKLMLTQLVKNLLACYKSNSLTAMTISTHYSTLITNH